MQEGETDLYAELDRWYDYVNTTILEAGSENFIINRFHSWKWYTVNVKTGGLGFYPLMGK